MENKNTDKSVISLPITVAQTQLANTIINDINASNLHPVIIMSVIEEVYMLMKNTLKETREREKTEYDNAIKAIAENSKDNESK